MKLCRLIARALCVPATCVASLAAGQTIELSNSLPSPFLTLVQDMTSVAGSGAGQLDNIKLNPGTEYVSFNTSSPEWKFGQAHAEVDTGANVLLFEKVELSLQPAYFSLLAGQSLEFGFIGTENVDQNEIGFARLDPLTGDFINTGLETSWLHDAADRDPGAPINVDADAQPEHYNPLDLVFGSATGGPDTANSHQLLNQYSFNNGTIPQDSPPSADVISILGSDDSAVNLTLWQRNLIQGGALNYLSDADTFNLFKIQDQDFYLLGIDDRAPSEFDADDGLFVFRIKGNTHAIPEPSATLPLLSLGLLLYLRKRRLPPSLR